MIKSIDTVVIGAGVIGLAVARALAQDGKKVLVLERHSEIGTETSARNSEVIHAGLYYETGSLKATLCADGKARLYEYCATHEVPYKQLGKLVIAVTDDQIERLQAIKRQATDNGIRDIQMLDTHQLSALEPQLRAVAALHSPSTGIVDIKQLMRAFQKDIYDSGSSIACNHEFTSAQTNKDGIALSVRSHSRDLTIQTRIVINCAGLSAPSVAQRLCNDSDMPQGPTQYAKGNYFSYTDPSPFKHLVYPLPMHGGLGIHATIDLAGKLRFGPDVEWVDELNYDVDPARHGIFVDTIKDYWPALDRSKLHPAYAGIRPKLRGPEAPSEDFSIQLTQLEDCRVINLLGMESPGLTSVIAIGNYVCDQLAAH